MEKEYDSNDFSRLPEADIYAALFETWGDEDSGPTQGEINAYRLGAASWDDELNSLAAERDRLREALQFYADRGNWVDISESKRGRNQYQGSMMSFDSGHTARLALEEPR